MSARRYAKFRRENGGSGTPSYGDPALAADTISRGYNKLSRDQGQRLVAKERRARSSVISVADVTAVLARREPAQHGVGSAAFAKARSLQGSLSEGCSGASRRRCPTKVPEAREGNLARMEKQTPNTLTPLCLRRSHQQRDSFRLEERASVSNSVTSEPSVPLSKAAKWGNSVLSGNSKHLSIPAMCSLVTQSTTWGMAH